MTAVPVGGKGVGDLAGAAAGLSEALVPEPTSNYKFGVLKKIVRVLRENWQDGNKMGFSFEELLKQSNQADVDPKTREFLVKDAIPKESRIRKVKGAADCYVFQPPLDKCTNKKSLRRLLKQHDEKGLGGIMLDDVMESVPNAEKVLRALELDIVTITRKDKKKVLFHRDRKYDIPIDESIKELWRRETLAGLELTTIEETLVRDGLLPPPVIPAKRPVPPSSGTKKVRTKAPPKIRDNRHVTDLIHYDL